MNAFILTGYLAGTKHYSQDGQEYLCVKLNINGNVGMFYATNINIINKIEELPLGTYISMRGHIELLKYNLRLVIDECENLHLLNYNEVESMEKGFSPEFLDSLVGDIKWMKRSTK